MVSILKYPKKEMRNKNQSILRIVGSILKMFLKAQACFLVIEKRFCRLSPCEGQRSLVREEVQGQQLAMQPWASHKPQNERFRINDFFSFIILIVKYWALFQIIFPK